MISSTDMNTNVAIGVSGNIVANFIAGCGVTVDGVIATLSISILIVTFARAILKVILEYRKLRQFDNCKDCDIYKEM